MPKKKRTLASFQSESLNYLVSNTPFSNVSPGSSARSITDITNLQMANLSTDISDLSYNCFLDTAGGYYLDLLGSMFNLRRYYPSAYVTTAGDKNIKFFTKGVHSLKRILESNIIPSGISIASPDGTISMTVIEEAEFNDTATHVFVSARLSKNNKELKIGPNTITQHALGNSDKLFVTNTSLISYNAFIESDSSFRDRISNAVIGNSGANESAAISAIRNYPDISDVDIRPNVSGSGTFDVYLVPVGNRVSQATATAVREEINSLFGFGITAIIREFDYIPLKLEVKVTFNSTAQNAEKETMILIAENAIEKLIGNLRPNQSLSMSRIVATVINSSRLIDSAEVVYLCVDKKVRAITDLLLEDDELFVPDSDEINPIMVRQ